MVSLNRAKFSDYIRYSIGKLIVCIYLCVFAQRTSAQYFTERKENTRCNISSRIMGISEDTNGFILLASQDGLYRYDGNTVINYSRKYPDIFSTNRFSDIRIITSTGKHIITDEFGNRYTIDTLGNIKPMKVLPERLFGFYNNTQVSLIKGDSININYINNTPVFFNLDSKKLLYRYHHSFRTILENNVKYAEHNNGIVYTLTTHGPASFTLPDCRKHPIRVTGELSGHKDWQMTTLVASSPHGIPVLWYKGRLYEVSGDTVWYTKLLAVTEDTIAPAIVYFNRERQIMLQGFKNTGVKEYTYCQYRLLNAAPYSKRGNYYYSIVPDADGFISAVDSVVFRKKVSGGIMIYTSIIPEVK